MPVIALLTLYIAYQQYSVNRRRFRNEVYERRLVIYKELQKFLNDITINRVIDYPSCSKFYNNTAESSFLFNKPIQDKIEEIYKNAIEMAHLDHRLLPTSCVTGDELEIIAKKESEKYIWLVKQREIVKELFQKEMSLKEKTIL